MTRLQAGVFVALLTATLWGQQAAKPPAPTKSSAPGAGAISNGVYRNPSFGFSCKLPYGWVDRTSEMQGNTLNPTNAAAKSLLLLAIFERPPEATGDTVNSAVVIAAEALSSDSAIKTAIDYFGSLTELATAKGFQPVEDPYAFSIGATQLVRGDFSKLRGTATVRQTSLVILERGYAISFTFIGGSEDEVNELIEKLSFAPRKPAH
jgi:hypothetical protein